MKGKEDTSKSSTYKLPPMKPRALVCYICGREYGTSSLDIHLKTCKKKWEQDQEKLPPGKRKPLPQPPKQMEDLPLNNKSGAAS